MMQKANRHEVNKFITVSINTKSVTRKTETRYYKIHNVLGLHRKIVEADITRVSIGI